MNEFLKLHLHGYSPEYADAVVYVRASSIRALHGKFDGGCTIELGVLQQDERRMRVTEDVEQILRSLGCIVHEVQ